MIEAVGVVGELLMIFGIVVGAGAALLCLADALGWRR